jgi:hypothetical protein
MAGTRRTPIDRPPRPLIDAEALAMYRAGLKLIAKGQGDSPYFRKLDLALRQKLGLRPWHESPFCVCDEPPDDAMNVADWRQVRDLRLALDKSL